MMLDLVEPISRQKQFASDTWQPRSVHSTAAAPTNWLISPPARHSLVVETGNLQFVIGGAPSAKWFCDAANHLANLAALRPDWNSHGAPAIKKSCILETFRFLSAIARYIAEPPFIAPTVRGGVQLEWHRCRLDLEIEVLGPHHYRVFVEDQSSGEAEEFDVLDDFSRIVPFTARASKQLP
jgi:hypothetical protein